MISQQNVFLKIRQQATFEWVCWACVTISILSPHLMYRELQAFRYCFFQGHVGYPDTLIGFMFAYIPLCYNAFKEWLQLVGTFIQAPRFIYEELIQIHRSDEHVLQNISLCGRKVLSWSKKISVNDVRRACIKHGVSPTELFMSGIDHSIYFQIRNHKNMFFSVRQPIVQLLWNYCMNLSLCQCQNRSESLLRFITMIICWADSQMMTTNPDI